MQTYTDESIAIGSVVDSDTFLARVALNHSKIPMIGRVCMTCQVSFTVRQDTCGES
jgi:hypothetical protein